MQRNITFDLIEHARAQPSAPALLLPCRIISYRELDGLVWRYAHRLHGLGVRPGQVVGITFSEELGLVLTLLALGRLGATSCSIPRSASAMQRRQLAARAELSWLASDQPERYDAGLSGLRLTRQAIEAMAISEDRDLLVERPEAPWLLISGSGSTGSPKLIPLTHGQARARATLGASCLQLTPADRVAALSQLDFAHSKYRLLEALSAGAAYALGAWRGGAASPGYCARLGLSVLYATVFHACELLAAADGQTLPLLAGLRALELSASTVDDALRRRIIGQLTPRLHVRYGCNEAGPISIAHPHNVLLPAGSVGRPLCGVELEIVDRRGQAMPAGTVGLVRVRSPGLVTGYRGDAAGTLENFQHGGFCPSDLGLLTGDGELVHYGRADHLMIVNGMNLYPAEIERVMCAHPEVADAIALPLRHLMPQDIPVCALALKPGSGVSEAELLAHARERLGALAPRRIVVFEALPRTPAGKIARADIERLLMARFGPRHQLVTAAGKPQVPPRQQRAKRIRHLFWLDGQADPLRLDGWIAATMPQGSQRDAVGASRAVPQGQATEWLRRALLLARWLLQAGNIPVFDPPQILALAQVDAPAAGTGQPWRADLALGLVEQLPTAAYVEALTAALKLCELAAGLMLTEASLQTFYARADQARARLCRFMPAGKSTLPLLRAAHEQGISFSYLGAGVFQLGWGSQACRLERSASGLDTAIGARLAQSKVQTAHLLRAAGLPAPEHEAVNRMPAALTAARGLGWPVVVKPADLERGEGVTVDVTDEAQLGPAFALAQRLSSARQVIVERQVAGYCHRLVIARGQLLYAVKRLPMSVTGDGRRSIAELVDAEWRAQLRLPPWSRSGIRPLDELALAELAAAGHLASSVPAPGMRIALRRIESTEWGGVDEEVSAAVHPENLRIAQEAASLLGLDIAGIDLITTDIARPWYENGAIVNEVNHSPQLGGGEISRRHLPALLNRLLPGRGRIPIEIFVGGEAAWTAASLRWQQLLAEGMRAYLSSASLTLTPSGEPRHLPWASCYQRARALALSTGVDALVLAVTTREFAAAEPPFTHVDRVVRQDGLRLALPAA